MLAVTVMVLVSYQEQPVKILLHALIYRFLWTRLELKLKKAVNPASIYPGRYLGYCSYHRSVLDSSLHIAVAALSTSLCHRQYKTHAADVFSATNELS